MKFGHLIFSKNFKFVATGCEILMLKCTKFNFVRSPDLAGFKGPTFKGGRVRGVEWEGEREGLEGNKKGGKRKGPQKLVYTLDVRNPEKYRLQK